MSKRLITTLTAALREVRVYFDTDLREYSVVLYSDNVIMLDATYYTDDHADALTTAKLMLEHSTKEG